MKWEKNSLKSKVWQRQRDIVSEAPRVCSSAKEAKTILDAWRQIFNDNILEKIVNYTNIYMKSQHPNYSREIGYKLTCQTELKAVLGLLYIAEAMKSYYQI